MKRCIHSAVLIALLAVLTGCPEPNTGTPSLRVTPAAVSLAIDETQRLTVTSTDAADTFTFSSSNSGVVSVSVSGLLTGVSEGNATITVTGSNSGLTATVPATVPGAMNVTPTAVLLRPSRSALLRAESSNPQDSFVWTSANRDVALVNNAGLVTGVAVGETTITVRGSVSGSEATAFVTIAGSAGVGIDVTPAELVLRPGQTSSLTANSTDDEDTFTWISSNPTVATIDENGVVTAIAEGQVSFNVTGSNSRASGVALGAVITQPLADITINPPELVLRPGNTTLLTANSTEATDEILWSSSDSNVATIGAGGRVTAVGGGRAFLIAEGTQSGATGTSSLTVLGDPATRVTLSPSEIVLRPTQQTTLTPQSSHLDDTFGWTSTDEAVATVDENGLITAVAEGEATIVVTGSVSGVSSTSLVNVVGRAPAVISVNPTEVVLRPTRVTKLEARSTDPEDTFTWSSSDNGVAVIDGDGIVTVTAIAVGEVTVVATGTASNDSGSATVTVAGRPPATITIDPGQIVLRPTRTTVLRATSSELQDIIRWSTSDASVAMISSGGRVTAMAEGTATISAVGSLSGATATAQVSIEGRAPANVTLDPDEITLRPTRSTTLTATSENVDDTFTWASDNEAVATVDANGRVVAIATGQANIVATGSVSGDMGTAQVSVEGTPPASITIDPEAIVIQPERTSALTASSTLETDVLSWASADEGTATVDATGMVTGVAEGVTTVTVTGSVSGATNSTQVTVSGTPPATIEVVPPGLVLRPTLTALLAATSTDALDEIAWTSSDEAVATVDTTGKVTALTVGIATVTATGTRSGATSTTRVTVAGAEPAEITVTPDNVVLRPTLTLTLDANSTDDEDEFAWMSSNPAVATIDAAGMVTAITEGEATITATGTHSSDSGSTRVTVSGTAPTTVTLTPNTVVLRPTRTATLVASSSNTDDVFSWSSTNPTVATVDANGLVSALTNGETTVVASGSLSQATGTARITVSGTSPATIDITPVGIELKPTQTVVLVANSTNLEDAFTWTSTDTNVVVVESDGTVSAVEEGETTVTATGTLSGAIGSAVISVSGSIPAEIGVVPATRTLRVRESAVLVATSNNANDTFTWSSSNNAVATVDATGRVTGVTEGQVSIVATGSSSGASGMATVTISGRLPAVISISPTVNVLRPTQTLTLTASSTDSADTFTWSSSDTNIATITPAGVVAAVVEGEVTVTAIGSNSGDSGTTTVTVAGRAPAEISITPTEPVVRPLQETTLSATSSDPTDIIIWTVDDESIATAEHDGTIRGLAVGETEVIATGSMSGDSASVTLTVAGRPFADIVVNPVETALRVGEVGLVSATSTDTEDEITWTSSNTAVATVLPDGSVVANAVGVSQLTATGTASGDSGMGQVTVGSAEVTISSTLLPLHAGSTETMVATSTDPNDRKFTWTSSNTDAAIVSPTGVVLGVALGTTTIRAVGNVSGSAGLVEVTVVPTVTSLLLWDGESGFRGEYGRLNSEEAFRGVACFEGMPDFFHTPALDLLGESFRTDLSRFDEIWFFAKVTDPGNFVRFSTQFFPHNSREGNSQPLTEEYELVRIPIANLRTTNYQVDAAERLYFNISSPNETKRLFVDDIRAVSLAPYDGDLIPIMGEATSTDFGSASVGARVEREITLTNRGTKSLTVFSLALFGTHPGEFDVPDAQFTIAPNDSYTFTAAFVPTTVLNKEVGDKSAQLVLTHELTPFGSTTTIPLFGRALSPAIEVSRDRLEFGSVRLGLSATKKFSVTNVGNGTLSVNSVSATSPTVQILPASFSLEPGEVQSMTAIYMPTGSDTLLGSLSIQSNATNAADYTVDLTGSGRAVEEVGALTVLPGEIDTNSVQLSWPQITGAATVNVYFGPEPADTENGALPLQRLIASLSGDTTEYTVEGLAPAVDVFFHLEVLDIANLPIATGNAYARVDGGPEAELDPTVFVQEVHLYAPDILQIVVVNPLVHSGVPGADTIDWGIDGVVGDTGDELQQATWTITRQDNSPITVTDIHRLTSPVGPSIEAPGKSGVRTELFDLEHHLFLVLSEPVGSRDILDITGPEIIRQVVNPRTHAIEIGETFSPSFTLPFSDKYLETPAIKVNQIGYSPQASQRYAYVSGWMGDGGALPLTGYPATSNVLIDPADPAEARSFVVQNLGITSRQILDDTDQLIDDPFVGSAVREIDLSTVPPAEGTVYRVHIPGVGVSWPTQVSETAVYRAYFTIARGLTYNRWGRFFSPDWTEFTPRPPEHTTVFTNDAENWRSEVGAFRADTPQVGQRFLEGGHHDAGDFDIRPQHYTVGMFLLRAYEVQKDFHLDGQLNIRESGNGIPDLLDEALWSVAAWEQLQDEDGGVRAGAESYSHPGEYNFADLDDLPYFTFGKEPYHTMRVAGLFAQAARLVDPYDPQRANTLIDRAIAAYAYATANGINEDNVGPTLYAAGELYGVTGDSAYADVFEAIWMVRGNNFRSIPPLYTIPPEGGTYNPSTELREHIDYVFGYFEGPEPDMGFFSRLDIFTSQEANAQVRNVQNLHAYRNGRTPANVISSGYGTVTGRWLLAVYARIGLGVETMEDFQPLINAVSLSADYVLGCNPMGRTWLSGMGSRPPLHVLHGESQTLNFLGEGHIPGIPVYGPVPRVPDIFTYSFAENLCYPEFGARPFMLRYVDVSTWAVTNEFTVWENQAPHAALFAVLLGPGMMPPDSWKPGGENYANPLAPRESAVMP